MKRLHIAGVVGVSGLYSSRFATEIAVQFRNFCIC